MYHIRWLSDKCEKKVNKSLPAPSKGCQWNPKGWWIFPPCNGTIWHPLEGPGSLHSLHSKEEGLSTIQQNPICKVVATQLFFVIFDPYLLLSWSNLTWRAIFFKWVASNHHRQTSKRTSLEIHTSTVRRVASVAFASPIGAMEPSGLESTPYTPYIYHVGIYWVYSIYIPF